MERITYRITLDAHKNGIQRTLQGFETADNMARRISVNIMSKGDTYEIPSNNVTALIYVTTPDATEPSINEYIIYDFGTFYRQKMRTSAGITAVFFHTSAHFINYTLRLRKGSCGVIKINHWRMISEYLIDLVANAD